MSLEQKNVLVNTEPTLKKKKNAQAIARWKARYLSPWTWARLEVQTQARGREWSLHPRQTCVG